MMKDLNEIELDGKSYITKEANLNNGCGVCAFRGNSALCLEAPCFHDDRADGQNVIWIEKKEEVQLNKEEKKEEFKLPDNMKIWCATKDYATEVQEKLFSFGCKWGDNSTKVWHPTGKSDYAIYCRNGKLTYEETHVYFEEQKCDEYILDETLDTCFVKVHKENEEVFSADSNSPDSFGVAENKVNEVVDIKPDDKSLETLFNQIVLLQKETDALSEQKEQIASKISANTQAINILKEKMQELVSQVGLVFVGVDKADVAVGDDEPLNITDWRDLKIGDIVYVFGEDCVVCEVEPEDYAYDYAFAVMAEEGMLWVDVSCDNWKFVSRPK